MRLHWIAILALAVAGTCGPTATTQPYYHANQVITDPSFEGRWIQRDTNGLIISRRNSTSYLATSVTLKNGVPEDTTETPLILHFTRINGVLYADACKADGSCQGNAQRHILVRFDEFRPELRIVVFWPDSALLVSGAFTVRTDQGADSATRARMTRQEAANAQWGTGESVITSSTDQLRAAIARVARDTSQWWPRGAERDSGVMRYLGPP